MTNFLNFIDTYSKPIEIAAKRNNEFLFNAIIQLEFLLIRECTEWSSYCQLLYLYMEIGLTSIGLD